MDDLSWGTTCQVAVTPNTKKGTKGGKGVGCWENTGGLQAWAPATSAPQKYIKNSLLTPLNGVPHGGVPSQ